MRPRPGAHPFGLDGPRPVLLAHRGGGLEAPENSPAAFARLAELGVDFLETDAHASSDAVVVVTHDPTLERTTDGVGKVRDHTWAQLADLRNEAGEGLMRLDRMLAEHPHLKVNVDAKDPSVVEPLIALLRDGADLGRMCLASFSTASLRRLRRGLGPRAATSLGPSEVVALKIASVLPGPLSALVRLAVPRPHRRGGVITGGALCVQVPERHRGVRLVTRDFVRTAHAHGLAVHVWTVDEPEDVRRLLSLGVDGIITDRPSGLVDLLG